MTAAQRKKYRREQSRKWRAKNRLKARRLSYDAQIKFLYGITRKERDKILKENNGRCRICHKRPSKHLDHNHKTKTIRGALCQQCNMGLGLFKDDIELLNSAIKYLQNG